MRLWKTLGGKGETAFSPFTSVFSTLLKKEKSLFEQHLFCRLQMLSIWSRPKICRLEASLKYGDNQVVKALAFDLILGRYTEMYQQ